MLGDSSGVLAPPPPTSGCENQPLLTSTAANHDNIEVGGGVDEDKGGDRSNFGGHRWPRQETLALLRIRSEMDLAFRDASAKGPLWDEISRKLAELGYNRSSKKCKEKFENVYKYHKRTKEGRSGKSETKTYRFFDQLQALENHQSKPQIPETTMSVTNNPPLITTTVSQITVPSTTVSATANQALNASLLPQLPANPLAASFPNISGDLISNSTSSSTSSDVELEGRRGKRKWTDFFERLMVGVVEKQEELQKKFLEALEKREQERLVREETWRHEEMARINREREILAHERSVAAAKDAAVMSFLQKIAQQDSAQPQSRTPPAPAPAPAAVPVPVPIPAPQSVALPIMPQQQPNLEASTRDSNGDNSFSPTSSSRWPKAEVEALIGIRTSLDYKYQDNGPKGPLWEDISAGMRKIGYNRSAKRCKEKWENINKYFKKVRESNKTRPEDSKTCPYFSQLDALYREKKNKSQVVHHDSSSNDQSVTMMPQNAVPLMVRPEQQWPPPPPPPPQQDLVTEDAESDQNQDELDEDEDDEDDGGDHFEIVASKPQTSMGGSTGE